jgi:hypothetical protein
MTAAAESDDDIWDSLWHGAAWRAYAELVAEQGFPPDREATRRRAYRYYEDALAEKNRRKAIPALTVPPR